MDVIEALNWRYAVRRFSTRKLPSEQVDKLIEATCLSASSYGLQPYQILVIESTAIKRRLLPFAMGQDKVADCSHLVVFASRLSFDLQLLDEYLLRYAEIRHTEKGRPATSASHEKRVEKVNLANWKAHISDTLLSQSAADIKRWAEQQTFIALGNFLTAAALMKIDACPVGGFEVDGIDRVLGLRERGFSTAVICPLGFRHPEDFSAVLPKVRMPQSTLVARL